MNDWISCAFLSETFDLKPKKFCNNLMADGIFYHSVVMSEHLKEVRVLQWHPTPVLLPGKSHGQRSLVGCSPWGRSELDTTEWLHFHALEKEMATHSSVLAWRIPGTAEPAGLPSMGSHRVGHDWSDLAAAGNQRQVGKIHIHRLCLASFPFCLHSLRSNIHQPLLLAGWGMGWSVQKQW